MRQRRRKPTAGGLRRRQSFRSGKSSPERTVDTDEVLGWIRRRVRNQAVIDTDKLREAAEALVQLIKFIRAVSSDPGENLNLQASTRSMHQLNQDLRNLLEVMTKIMENIGEFIDFHCLHSGFRP